MNEPEFKPFLRSICVPYKFEENKSPVPYCA